MSRALTMLMPRRKVAIWLLVGFGLLVLVVANGHLVYVAMTSQPDCVAHVAFGGSLLIFRGDPGTVIGGTGRFLHASGRVISSREVSGGSDVVAKIRF